MRRKLLKDVKSLTASYQACKAESVNQKIALKKLRRACRYLVDISKSERKLQECCNAIPGFCYEYDVATKRLNRLLRLKAANKKARNERIGQFIEYATRMLFFRKSLEI